MSIYIYIYNTHHIMYVGVLGIIFSYPFQERKWLVFDGPVDAVWIENMKLGDAKRLSPKGPKGLTNFRADPKRSIKGAPRGIQAVNFWVIFI